MPQGTGKFTTGRRLVRVAVGIAQDDAGRVLVTQRVGGQHLEHYWEWPGGKLEEGELPSEALSREMREEVGAEIESARPCCFVEHDYGDRVVLLYFFEVRLLRLPETSPENLRMMWVDLDSLWSLPFPEANRLAVEVLSRSAKGARMEPECRSGTA